MRTLRCGEVKENASVSTLGERSVRPRVHGWSQVHGFSAEVCQRLPWRVRDSTSTYRILTGDSDAQRT